MDKELKALHELILLAGMDDREVSIYEKKGNDFNDDLERCETILKQALTPPTAEEVCEAYKKHHGCPLIYRSKQRMFEEIKGGRARGKIIAIEVDGNVKLLHPLNNEVLFTIATFFKGVN